ncbi:MAG: YdcH family protein [Phenylobacterium sp.]
MSEPVDPGEEAASRRRLSELQLDHNDLDVAIQAIGLSPLPDMMVIGRLKRKKLALKDEIQRLKDQLTPDIIA